MLKPLFVSCWLFGGFTGDLPAQIGSRESSAALRLANWSDKKVGLFIHWGPYSALGGEFGEGQVRGNSEWIMKTAQISRERYRQAASEMSLDRFSPAELVKIAGDSGFRYMILTAKHYDGFAMFDSEVTDFDAGDVFPDHPDPLKEFSEACEAAHMPLGFTYSIDKDWYHPGGNTLGPAWDPNQEGIRDEYLEKVAFPQVKKLLSDYGPVFSMHFDSTEKMPRNLQSEFQKLLSPGVVVPRDFSGRRSADYTYTDSLPVGRTIGRMFWEKCTSMHNSWGFKRTGAVWRPAGDILRELVTTVSNGGNYLLNVGLDDHARFPEEAMNRFRIIGSWLDTNGESIYGCARSPFSRHSWDGASTFRSHEGESFLYIHLFGDHHGNEIVLNSLISRPVEAAVLGTNEKLSIGGVPGQWVLDGSRVRYAADVTVVKVKLDSDLRIGPGAVEPGQDGHFRLAISAGSYAGSGSSVGRTPESADLVLSSFGRQDEICSWRILSPDRRKVRVRLLAESTASLADSELAISIDGEQVGHARPVQDSFHGDTSCTFESEPITLSEGACVIEISRPNPGKDPKPISTSDIQLILSH